MLYLSVDNQPTPGPIPRKPRFFLPGVPVHVVRRGNNQRPIFSDDIDDRACLHWLKEASGRWSCRIHAYVLMTNHVHLLLTERL
ncbi:MULTISPECIES: transposase [unclassified Thiocapsa]|uniref:transposase n=1 Tax=unclassified Thiocapsa TaxID=2641286 RepID=UPI0035B297FF